MNADIIYEYSRQSGSGSLPYFVGRQYGQGWLRNIAKFAFPFLKKAVGAVGNIASNTAESMIHNEGKTFGSALKESASKEASNIINPKPTVSKRSATINKGRVGKRRRVNHVL